MNQEPAGTYVEPDNYGAYTHASTAQHRFSAQEQGNTNTVIQQIIQRNLIVHEPVDATAERSHTKQLRDPPDQY